MLSIFAARRDEAAIAREREGIVSELARELARDGYGLGAKDIAVVNRYWSDLAVEAGGFRRRGR